jgi:hypothetical protein
VEAELTPKPLRRTSAIMAGLLERTADYGPQAQAGRAARYDRVIYLCAPAARPVVTRAVAGLAGP